MIARIALGDDTLAAPAYWEDTEDLRVLVSYRRELVKDRTAGANRLHADVGKLRPGYQQNIRRLTTHKALKEAMRLFVVRYQPPRPGGQAAHPDATKPGPPDQRTHHPDRGGGHRQRNPPT